MLALCVHIVCGILVVPRQGGGKGGVEHGRCFELPGRPSDLAGYDEQTTIGSANEKLALDLVTRPN